MSTFTLYKYRAINDWSLKSLRLTKMWFSLPTKLNDTFEFSLPIFISMSSTELVEHYEKRFSKEYIAPELLAALMKCGGSDSFPVSGPLFLQGFLDSSSENRSLFCIAAVHFLRDRGLTTQEIAKQLKLDLDSELAGRLQAELRDAYDQNQAIGRTCGVLSLSARRDDPLMWAHYADSCRGVCIGVTFEFDDLSNSELLPLRVEYAEELPVLAPSKFFDRVAENSMDMLKLFYGTKHTAWSHEAEFRLVSRHGDAELELPARITEVILGEKTESAAAGLVLEAVRGRSETQILKMTREPGTWNYRPYRIAV
jgi:hypothetical protein